MTNERDYESTEEANSLLSAALGYAERGWKVLPLHTPLEQGGCTCRRADCVSVGKHPRTARGLHEATTDPATIRRWWATWPTANIGVVVPDGHVLIDVDGPEGVAALAGYPLPDTATAQTGREAGAHYLYRTDAPVATKTGALTHVDVRGYGSYFVAPPSTHASGVQYRWVVPPEEGVADAPSWVTTTASRTFASAEGGLIPQGQRNTVLTSMAGSMRRHGMTEAAIEAALLTENRARCAPPLHEDEVRRISRSVSRYAPEERNPATPQEPLQEDAAPAFDTLAETLGATRDFLIRFVAFSAPTQADAIVLWVCHTYVFDQFDTSPILAVTSAEKRSGKSRLFEVLDLLVNRPWRAVSPSDAVVYRKIEQDHPTFMLDEADAIFGKATAAQHEGLRALLNAGNRRGTRVPRVAGDGARMTIVEFDVFTPKVIAGIGSLPDTVADRAIPIRLRRRSSTERVERFSQRKVEPLAMPIRTSLRFYLMRLDLSGATPDIPPELDDRAADGWEPLLAIADEVGGSWPERARRAALGVSADREVDEDSLSHLLLADLRELFDEQWVTRLHTADIIAALIAMEERPWPTLYGHGVKANDLARLLKPYDVESKALRVGERTLKGYTRADLEDAWNRYLPPVTPERAEKGYSVADSDASDVALD